MEVTMTSFTLSKKAALPSLQWSVLRIASVCSETGTKQGLWNISAGMCGLDRDKQNQGFQLIKDKGTVKQKPTQLSPVSLNDVSRDLIL